MFKMTSGEFIFIVLFCTTYAIIANIESRLHPVEGSIAYRQRAFVSEKINKIDRQEKRLLCENQALRFKSVDNAIIWYHNKESGEYWCGYIVLSKLTSERADELKGHVTVLNSDKNVRRLLSENNKYKRQSRNVSNVAEW